MVTKKRNKKVTLSIDSATYDSFRKYCEENAIMLSKKVELWMKKELEKKNEK
ncbi:MAG: RepB family protein [Candidatus Woesearchaeota archaeon]